MKLYLVRHGQSIANFEWVHQGRYDTGLTNLWRSQATAARDALAEVNVAAVYASNLLRAGETAQIIHQAHPDAPLTTSPLLEERKSPLGKRISKGTFTTNDKRYFLRYFLPLLSFLGFETDKKMQRRAQTIQEEIIEKVGGDGKHIVIVSHNDFLRHFIYLLLGKDRSFFKKGALANASITVLEQQDDQWKLLDYNLQSHLWSLPQQP